MKHSRINIALGLFMIAGFASVTHAVDIRKGDVPETTSSTPGTAGTATGNNHIAAGASIILMCPAGKNKFVAYEVRVTTDGGTCEKGNINHGAGPNSPANQASCYNAEGLLLAEATCKSGCDLPGAGGGCDKLGGTPTQ